MSYESPIKIICGEMENQLENGIYNVIQSYGIKVDKDELIKALEYDRKQYYQGYIDAKAEIERKKGKWIKGWRTIFICSECRNTLDFEGCDAGRGDANFCPNCGADMRGE